ncbi:DUF11 domain-containing protein, partial [Variovorax sp. CYS-02]|nr:DUF11 domain-containing protein [Variovorax terrae]
MSGAVRENYGSVGYNGGLTTYQVPDVPGVPPAALCDPNLTLAKTDGVTLVTSPSVTTYTFTVANIGNGATSGTITVSDKLTTGLTVTPGVLTPTGPQAANWSCSAANATDIVCTSTTAINGGGTSVFALPVSVAAANGTSLVNRARVFGGGDPNKANPANAAAAVTAAIACTANNNPAGCALDTDTVQAPNLVLTKTDSTSVLARGGTTTYTLVVTNGGGTATTGTITVADLLPTGLTFAGTATVSNFVCTTSGQGITCNRTTALAAGASATITFRVTVDNNAPSAVTNLAQVGGGGDPSPNKSTRPTTATAALCPAPVSPADTSFDPNNGCAADTDEVRYVRLQLSKDDGQIFVNANSNTDYVFTVLNNGTMATVGTINFRDVSPGTLTFVTTGTFTPAGPNGADWSCTRVSTVNVSCTSSVSIPAGGASSFILTASVGNATVGSQQRNKARIGGGGDVTPGIVQSPAVADVNACTTDGNPVGCAIDLNTVQNAAEVRLTKSHANPQTKFPGQTVTFSLVVSNGGGTSATGTTTVADVLPTGLTYTSPASPFTQNGFTCTVTGQNILCNRTTALAAGASATITYTATVALTATTTLVNQAKVGGGGDPQNGTLPNAAAAALCSGQDVPNLGCAVDPVPLPVVATNVSKAVGSATVAAGSTTSFTLVFTNAGPSTLTGASFNDVMPANLQASNYSSTVTGGASTANFTVSASGIAGSVTIPVGGQVSVSVNVTATASGSYVNTVTLNMPAGTTNNGTSTATVSGVVTPVADLVVSKVASSANGTAGATISYTVTLVNLGPSAAQNVTLTDV